MYKPDSWINEYPGAITVCDINCVILYMNTQAAEQVFKADGGYSLIGKNLLDCHPPSAKEFILDLLKNGKSNTYTIEKVGIKKLIHQSPWFDNGIICGLVELSFIIPNDMPHFIRKGQVV